MALDSQEAEFRHLTRIRELEAELETKDQDGHVICTLPWLRPEKENPFVVS